MPISELTQEFREFMVFVMEIEGEHATLEDAVEELNRQQHLDRWTREQLESIAETLSDLLVMLHLSQKIKPLGNLLEEAA